jgi:hypothetical protein
MSDIMNIIDIVSLLRSHGYGFLEPNMSLQKATINDDKLILTVGITSYLHEKFFNQSGCSDYEKEKRRECLGVKGEKELLAQLYKKWQSKYADLVFRWYSCDKSVPFNKEALRWQISPVFKGMIRDMNRQILRQSGVIERKLGKEYFEFYKFLCAHWDSSRLIKSYGNDYLSWVHCASAISLIISLYTATDSTILNKI